MKRTRKQFGRFVPLATGVWLVLIAIYIITNWRVFELSYKPAVQPGTRWNNLWLSGGRVAWSRFDPAQASSAMSHQPSGVRVRSYAMPNGSWFWKPYFARQAGGWFVGVPLWIPAAPLSLIGPVPVLIQAGRAARSMLRRRGSDAVCAECGYSLHGLRSSICPECGRQTRPQAFNRGNASEQPSQPPWAPARNEDTPP